jgi:hypothetical protein
VESNDFEVLVVGGEIGVRICERCKGLMRSIILGRDEIAWLVRIFKELVVAEDSQVFWDQSWLGFPRLLAQCRFNKHDGFLVVEEFDGGRRRGSILLPEGRHGKGWVTFGLVLRLVHEHLRVGVRDVAVELEV